jgi:hypothetical protein
LDKLERKVSKLRDCIELELEERTRIDNVINFFTSAVDEPTVAVV